MVFIKFSHVARPSLSKTFAHGYAQSIVAATQTSSGPFPPLKKAQQQQQPAAGRLRRLSGHTSKHGVLGLSPAIPTGLQSAVKSGRIQADEPGSDSASSPGYEAWHKVLRSTDSGRVVPQAQEISARSVDAPKLERSHSASALDDVIHEEHIEQTRKSAAANPTDQSHYESLLSSAVRSEADPLRLYEAAQGVCKDLATQEILPQASLASTIVELFSRFAIYQTQKSRRQTILSRRMPGIYLPGDETSAQVAARAAIDLIRDVPASLSTNAYSQAILCCALQGHVKDMISIYTQLECQNVQPSAAIFPAMIDAFAAQKDLASAVECYTEYRSMAIRDNAGQFCLVDRQDSEVHAALVYAYSVCGKGDLGSRFLQKILKVSDDSQPLKFKIASRLITDRQFSSVQALLHDLSSEVRSEILSATCIGAADMDLVREAESAMQGSSNHVEAYQAMLAMYVRLENHQKAADTWTQICAFVHDDLDYQEIAPSFRHFLDALVTNEKYDMALNQAQQLSWGSTSPLTTMCSDLSTLMLPRHLSPPQRVKILQILEKNRSLDEANIQTLAPISNDSLNSEEILTCLRVEAYLLDIGVEPNDAQAAHCHKLINSLDPKSKSSATVESIRAIYPSAQSPRPRSDDRGSAAILSCLDSGHEREAVTRFRNMRQAGSYPRSNVYARLIGMAAKSSQYSLVYEILDMARSEIPHVAGNSASFQAWSSILDAVVSTSLQAGHKDITEQTHRELLAIGAAPSANTFGLYITTLKESHRTFDEASEAVHIFNQALSEGVKPTPFLYNALIGKLGKARRIDDCLRYFQEMRLAGLRPTSVTYGTVINALCRVSDERLAEELFEEMESVPNYKARPAPYNSMMQFFLTRSRSKALAYYDRMLARGIKPTSHTYKLLIDCHASLQPVDLDAAEKVLDIMQRRGIPPEAVHYASLIHARGCVLHDLDGAKAVFDEARIFKPHACLYQALAESMVANHQVNQTEALLQSMASQRIPLTAYIANTLIHGWASVGQLGKARAIFDNLPANSREPSTFEAMARAHLSMDDHLGAQSVASQIMARGYPAAVAGKVFDLVHSHTS